MRDGWEKRRCPDELGIILRLQIMLKKDRRCYCGHTHRLITHGRTIDDSLAPHRMHGMSYFQHHSHCFEDDDEREAGELF
jgi:hypothetical protein